MPLVLPPFVQYQAPMFPLRGLWDSPPSEGDKFVSAEIDWLVAPPGNAVQFSLSGNSPVALSQIVALYCDNSQCGADVDFVFPDTAFQLTVPAGNQGLYPVLTNALMFYAVSTGAIAGDRTVFQICNSMPPPIPITPSKSLAHQGVQAVPLQTNATTPIVPAGTNGTLNSLAVQISGQSAGNANLFVADGAGHTLWLTEYFTPTAGVNQTFNPTNMNVRFVNGLNLTITASTYTSGTVSINAYYSQP